jgi:hypothetical protein
MRTLIVAAASLFLTLPALAQNATTQQSQHNPSGNSLQAPDSRSQNQNAQNQNGQNQNGQTTAKIAQQIRSNLEQAGFTNIKMMPGSFIVRAQDKDNNPVMMVINPDSITAVTESRNASPGNNSTVGQGPNAGSSAGNSGSAGQSGR